MSVLTKEHPRRDNRGIGLFQRLRDRRAVHMQGVVIGQDEDDALIAWDNDAGSGPLVFERLSRSSQEAYCPHPVLRWAGACSPHPGRLTVAEALDRADASERVRERMAARLDHGLRCYGVELRLGWRPALFEVCQELTDALIIALRWRLWQVSPGVGALVLNLIDALDLALSTANLSGTYDVAFSELFELDSADEADLQAKGRDPVADYVGVCLGRRALAVHYAVLDGDNLGHEAPLVFELDERARERVPVEGFWHRYEVLPTTLLHIALNHGVPRHRVNDALVARLRLGLIRYGRSAALLDEPEASPRELREACDAFLIELTDGANYAVAYDPYDRSLVNACLRLLEVAVAEPALTHTGRKPVTGSRRLCPGWTDIETWRRR